jgi:hypothetical protein
MYHLLARASLFHSWRCHNEDCQSEFIFTCTARTSWHWKSEKLLEPHNVIKRVKLTVILSWRWIELNIVRRLIILRDEIMMFNLMHAPKFAVKRSRPGKGTLASSVTLFIYVSRCSTADLVQLLLWIVMAFMTHHIWRRWGDPCDFVLHHTTAQNSHMFFWSPWNMGKDCNKGSLHTKLLGPTSHRAMAFFSWNTTPLQERSSTLIKQKSKRKNKQKINDYK